MALKISLIIGTRPEIIKMAPVIKGLEASKANFFVLHTGQHYSFNLDSVFFDQLKLAKPGYNIEAGSGSQAEQTARIMVGVERVLQKENPDIILVQGDTNSALASTLAAKKLQIKIGHVEAGLRSYDQSMPEEINRIVADHCSDFLFAPTKKAEMILLGEGISTDKISVTGNTIVDAVYQNRSLAEEQSRILEDLGLSPGEYFLVTVHRQENVDRQDKFASILQGLDRLALESSLPVIYPIHPHSLKRMEEFNLSGSSINIIDPVDYLAFLQLESKARLILTDSGGIQEEACILGIPCVTLRNNTERPETIEVGANIIAGTSPDKIVDCVRIMLEKKEDWQNPFGDGKASERIVSIITGGSDE